MNIASICSGSDTYPQHTIVTHFSHEVVQLQWIQYSSLLQHSPKPKLVSLTGPRVALLDRILSLRQLEQDFTYLLNQMKTNECLTTNIGTNRVLLSTTLIFLTTSDCPIVRSTYQTQDDECWHASGCGRNGPDVPGRQLVNIKAQIQDSGRR